VDTLLCRVKKKGDAMGTINTAIERINPIKAKLKRLVLRALVDTEAMTLCIPEHLAIPLQLHEIEKREVTTADDQAHIVPYTGPIQIRFQNRTCFTGPG
jgi:hypothetical protein